MANKKDIEKTIKDQLIELMKEKGAYQGEKFNYLEPKIPKNI